MAINCWSGVIESGGGKGYSIGKIRGWVGKKIKYRGKLKNGEGAPLKLGYWGGGGGPEIKIRGSW